MAERIAREANGHPLFIDELVRHAMQGGEERARTARLEDALVARVERVDDVQRQVLEAVAVAGGPLRLDVVAHATSIELAGLARAVSRLRIANLVRASGIRRVDLLDTYHDRVRAAVLALLDDDTRRTWHRRIAMAIEAHAPNDVDALVTHWRGAQDGEGLALRAHGRRARQRRLRVRSCSPHVQARALVRRGRRLEPPRTSAPSRRTWASPS